MEQPVMLTAHLVFCEKKNLPSGGELLNPVKNDGWLEGVCEAIRRGRVYRASEYGRIVMTI